MWELRGDGGRQQVATPGTRDLKLAVNLARVHIRAILAPVSGKLGIHRGQLNPEMGPFSMQRPVRTPAAVGCRAREPRHEPFCWTSYCRCVFEGWSRGGQRGATRALEHKPGC